jgi:ZIP family zinc transporter
VLLALGFALHQATEGFGIGAACGRRQRAAVLGGLALLGLIGGGPTFVGILVGQSA